MTTRILPPEEWPKLGDTGCELLQAQRDGMARGDVLVAEDADGQIVGTGLVMMAVHVDGLWVHPDHRRGDVARDIYRAIKDRAAALGAGAFLAPVKNPRLAAICQRRGYPEIAHVLVPVKGTR